MLGKDRWLIAKWNNLSTPYSILIRCLGLQNYRMTPFGGFYLINYNWMACFIFQNANLNIWNKIFLIHYFLLQIKGVSTHLIKKRIKRCLYVAMEWRRLCIFAPKIDWGMKDIERPYNIYRYKMQCSFSSPLLSNQSCWMTGQWAHFSLFSPFRFSCFSPRRHHSSCDSGGFFLSLHELISNNYIAWNH